MAFLSYAQNFEDVMLWRVLNHVGKGFYIDVGANDPEFDSVTKAFYDSGWSGINVEPLKSHFADLEIKRPNDLNLCCALGPEKGEIEIFEPDVRGWATASSDIVEKQTKSGHEGVYHKVPMRTLANVCEEHTDGEIHFLKIDVEGFEKQVLLGADLVKFRPWVIVVEATKPNSREESYDEWEHLITSNNYKFVYADGLNRFYLSAEHLNLVDQFKYPPNVFDEFVCVYKVANSTSQDNSGLLLKFLRKLKKIFYKERV